MAAPCALFTSCSSFQTKDFIKRILNVDDLPEPVKICENIEAYDWDVNTKYYTAKIQLCTTDRKTIGDKTFADSVQAFIVHFNNNEEKGLKGVESWLPFLDQLEVEIKLLVCETATDNHTVNRLTIQKWCIDNGFELVELQPEEESDSEDEFAETTGIKRIIQALHSHTWSNLEMKDNPDVRSPYIKQLMKEESESKISKSGDSKTNLDSSSYSNIPTGDTKSCRTSSNKLTENASSTASEKSPSKPKTQTKEERIDKMITDEEQSILTALGDEHQDQESFEQLFEKLKVMKDKAESLPMGERKVYAEKVAISFWKAIGGDMDEIDGLTDSDDDEEI